MGRYGSTPPSTRACVTCAAVTQHSRGAFAQGGTPALRHPDGCAEPGPAADGGGGANPGQGGARRNDSDGHPKNGAECVQQATQSRRSGRLPHAPHQQGRRVRPPPSGHRLRLLTATLSSRPPPHSVDKAPSEGRRGTRATRPRAVERPPTDRLGAGAAHPAPRAPTHTPGRPPRGGLPGGRPRSSLSQRERRAQPSWRAGPPYRHHNRGPGGGGDDANEHSHRTRGSPSGHRIRPMRHHTKPNMDGKSRGAVFCLAGRLGLGGRWWGWKAVLPAPARRERQGTGGLRRGSTRRCHHSPPVVGDALGQATDAGQMSPPTEPALDAPGVVDVVIRGAAHGDGHLERDWVRQRPAGQGLWPRVVAKAAGTGWEGGATGGNFSSEVDARAHPLPENVIGGRRHLVFPCQA